MVLIFQSTHPVWGATSPYRYALMMAAISIHAPRVGCDSWRTAIFAGLNDFNPRTPCGVRLSAGRLSIGYSGFQSTHPVWGATNGRSQALHESQISIHAPRVGCDHGGVPNRPRQAISIHAPRVGCDRRTPVKVSWSVNFNPRTPCGVRRRGRWTLTATLNFNPRTPCGVRRGRVLDGDDPGRISIHAPRVGCDDSSDDAVKRRYIFQSTHPVWGATLHQYQKRADCKHFNPRTPCGVRPALAQLNGIADVFQSTHPVWGATNHSQKAGMAL